MTTAEVIQFWGKQNLIRWPRAILDSTLLPEEAKAYLAEVGLPLNVDWTMRFDLDARRISRWEKNKAYCIIGYDYLVPICLREDQQGCVVWVEDEGGPERFGNFSVVAFGEFLALYQKYRLAILKLGDNEGSIQKLINETESAMKSVDPVALAGPENVWSTIVEQVRDGML
jgi:hypothetical protein